MAWYRRDVLGQGSLEKGAVGGPLFVEMRTSQTLSGRAVASRRRSAETGARRSVVTRRGGERLGGFDTCASVAMAGAGTEVLCGNRSR